MSGKGSRCGDTANCRENAQQEKGLCSTAAWGLWDKADDLRDRGRILNALGMALYLSSLLYTGVPLGVRDVLSSNEQIRAAYSELKKSLALIR